MMQTSERGSAREVAEVFLRLGLTAFGGPAAHIALFRSEFVQRRKWVTDDEFLDLLGVVNLIPGPNSTEMAIHLGFLRAGWLGLIAAGAAFIFPAFVIVLILAMLYVQYGTTPTADALLYGIKPVVIAIVAYAVYGLLPKAFKSPLLWLTGIGVIVLYFFGVGELVLLFGGGAAYVIATQVIARRSVQALFVLPLSALPLAQAAIVPVSLGTLFLTFLKIGGLLYGGGYVLLAFMRGDFVEALGWITNQQLLDAVAVGQLTPGPLFTTATFVGYLVAGFPGAVVATVGIFLPSFVFVAISSPLIPRMRRSVIFSALLDGVNAAALGLMAAVTVELAADALSDPLTIALAVGSLIALVYFKINATWLMVAGGVIGLLASVLFPI